MCYGTVGTPFYPNLYFIEYSKEEFELIKKFIEMPKQRFNAIYRNALKKDGKSHKKTLRCCRMVNNETREVLNDHGEPTMYNWEN